MIDDLKSGSANVGFSKEARPQPVLASTQGIPAAELMSFLREVGRSTTWTDNDLTKSLRMSTRK
jgi:hypothetical protein